MHNKLKKFTLNFLLNDVKRINRLLIKPNVLTKTKNKNHFDPVTNIDLIINEMIIKRIKKSFNNHNIFSEEVSDIKYSKSDYSWYIDPIDGTKNFLLGLKYFSILIGLFYKKKPLYSLIVYPSLNEIYFSIIKKSYTYNIFKNKIYELKSINKKKNNYTKIVTNTKNTLKSKKIINFFNNKDFLFKVTGADSMNYILLALNKIDIVIESGLKDVDILPIMNLLKNNNINYITWKNSKLIQKKNNSLIFFQNTKKNKFIVNNFLKIINS